MTRTMNSSFVSIATLVKSNLSEKCLINILMNISSQASADYLECRKIYKGASSKKKADLAEMIVHGHIINRISKLSMNDITMKETNQILKQSKINVKTLPGYADIGLKRKRSRRTLIKSAVLKYASE